MDSTGRPLVRCRGLACTYGVGHRAVVAVHGVTCAVGSPSRIALTGPSGCGKSTLLHLMNGLEKPTTGTVEWPEWDSPPPSPAHIGMVTQAANLLPDLDVAENVAFPLLVTGTDAATAASRSMAVLERFGVDHLACDMPDEISSGQAQRVAVTRALVARPRLVLADEPTAHLDRETAQRA